MNNTFTISFPGLGINGWNINSIAFTIPILGGIEVRWYGICIAIGMLMAIMYAGYRCKQHGISLDDLLDVAIFTIFFGVVGARAFYIIFNPGAFSTVKEMLGFGPQGLAGLAIYGGIIAGATTLAISCFVKKISWRKLFDCAGPGVMIAQAMGRWGNFFNGEAYGGITSLPWRMSSSKFIIELKNNATVSLTDAQLEGLQNGSLGVHPTFLYESLWNVLGFVIINLLYKKKKFDGEIALWYFGWYGFGRMLIEGLRTDSLYIGSTGIRVSQLLGFLLFALAAALTVYGRVVTKKKAMAVEIVEEASQVEETPEEK